MIACNMLFRFNANVLLTVANIESVRIQQIFSSLSLSLHRLFSFSFTFIPVRLPNRLLYFRICLLLLSLLLLDVCMCVFVALFHSAFQSRRYETFYRFQ